MKIYIAKFDPEHIGGGWKFQNNLAKALPNSLSTYEMADIYLIAGASMCRWEDVQKAKADGKKIVLRVDNIPRNSRNQGTGMARMKDFADWSALVIYQSKFCQELLQPYLKAKNHRIIYNSADQSIFNPNARHNAQAKYLYARSSDDETKNWEIARSAFQQLPNPKSLTIVGRALEPKISQRGFDFFMGEKVKYIGEIQRPEDMADVYKNHGSLLYSFFNDGCSNTLIEALCCGMKIHDCYGMLSTGGSPEIIQLFKSSGIEYFSLSRMAKDYQEAFQSLE
jgi:glycosyltransferase involved in cell wall biosynthesis